MSLRKMGLFGIGILALTQEKLEEFKQEMIEKGEMKKEECKNFVVEVLSEKDRQFKDIEEKISNKVRDTLDNSGLATKKDIQTLEKRIEILEKDIQVPELDKEEGKKNLMSDEVRDAIDNSRLALEKGIEDNNNK